MQEAEEIARKHLESLGLAAQIADRAVTVNRKGRAFKVVFTPPPGVRAGAFTITVGNDGTIIAQRFER